MSLAAATRKAYAVDAEAKSTQFRKAATDTDIESGLEKITQWIPSEVVTIYVALLGLFATGEESVRWIIFAVGAALVPTFIALNTAVVNKKGAAKWKGDGHSGEPPKLKGKRLVLLGAMGMVAYVVWAFALPDTPFLTLTDDATRIGGALVLVLAAAMPKIAELLDLKVPGT